jgi:hypothetical protein
MGTHVPVNRMSSSCKKLTMKLYSPVHVDVEPIKPLVTQAAAAQEVGRLRRHLIIGFHKPAVAVPEPAVHPLADAAAASAGHVRDDASVALGELVLLARAAPGRGADGDRLGPGQTGSAHVCNDAEPDPAGVEAPPRPGLRGVGSQEDGEEVDQGRGGRRQLGDGAPPSRRGLLLGCRLMRPHHPLTKFSSTSASMWFCE